MFNVFRIALCHRCLVSCSETKKICISLNKEYVVISLLFLLCAVLKSCPTHFRKFNRSIEVVLCSMITNLFWEINLYSFVFTHLPLIQCGKSKTRVLYSCSGDAMLLQLHVMKWIPPVLM